VSFLRASCACTAEQKSKTEKGTRKNHRILRETIRTETLQIHTNGARDCAGVVEVLDGELLLVEAKAMVPAFAVRGSAEKPPVLQCTETGTEAL
jgi:hypothetical protein